MSTDFTVTGDKIIAAGLRVIGALGSGETIPPEELVDCRQALNMLVKNMMAGPNPVLRGMKTWQRERKSITLTSKAKYTIKPSGGDLDADIPVKMISVRLKDTDSNETPLDQMTLWEYESLPNKAETNTPTRWYYERGISGGDLYLNAIPSDTTDTVEVTFLRTLNDIDTASDGVEFPQEYYRLLKYAFAGDIAPEYGLEFPQEAREALASAVALANAFAPEEEFYFFQPGLC